jgi:hypothetical protein
MVIIFSNPENGEQGTWAEGVVIKLIKDIKYCSLSSHRGSWSLPAAGRCEAVLKA